MLLVSGDEFTRRRTGEFAELVDEVSLIVVPAFKCDVGPMAFAL